MFQPIQPLPARWRAWDAVALTFVLGIAIAWRVYGIDATPSVDEVWHLALTRGLGSPIGRYASDLVYADVMPLDALAGAAPAGSIVTHLDGVLHPPLYLFVLRVWRDVFGSGFFVAHLLSIAWSAVAIAFAFASARLAIGRGGAIWAGAIAAVSPVQIYFGQEIRGYEQMIAVGAATLWVATRIEILGPTVRRATGLAALMFPLLLTHYFSAGAAAGIALYAAARLRGAPLRAFVITLAAAAVVYLGAWGPFAWRQLAALESGDAFTKVDRVDVWKEFLWAAAVPIRILAERPWIESAVGGATCAALGLAMLIAPWPAARRLSPLRPWAAWLGGGIAMIVLIDVARSEFVVGIVRYLAVVSPAVPLIVVGLGRCVGPRALHFVAATLVAAMLLVRPTGQAVLTDAPNFTGIAAWLGNAIAPGEAILVVEGTAGPHAADLVLMTLASRPGLFPRTVLKIREPLTADALRALPDRAWAVMVDLDPKRLLRTLGAATLLDSYGIEGEGLLNLYDLRSARAAASNAATRPATSRPPVAQ